MINNEAMFGFYKEALIYKHDNIINSCIISPLEEELMVELLQDIKKYHPEYGYITTITDFNAQELASLRISPSQRLFITNYINSINIIKENKVKAKDISTLKITKAQFSFILSTFNKLLWKAIIDEAYVFKYGLIGRIHAVCRKNESCKPKMNWKISLDNKQKILEKGGIPRVELEARSAEFYNKQYDGEKWIELHDPFNVTIIWKRTAYSINQIPTSKDFAMKLVRASNGVVQALKATRDNNRLDDLLIKYKSNHG